LIGRNKFSIFFEYQYGNLEFLTINDITRY
jgi:hypothetical protein